jgi:hypothetical protein
MALAIKQQLSRLTGPDPEEEAEEEEEVEVVEANELTREGMIAVG